MPEPKKPIIHSTKLFGGRETAQQLHQKYAWNDAKCNGCGAPAAMRVQVFVLLSDMSVETRTAVLMEIAQKKLHTVRMQSGPAIRASVAFACRMCSPALEREAAKGPSFAICDIERGPGEDKIIVGVA